MREVDAIDHKKTRAEIVALVVEKRLLLVKNAGGTTIRSIHGN